MTWEAHRAPTGSDRPLSPIALDKTQNLALEPARDPLARRVVGAVQNVLVWHIDPCVRRVGPAREIIADIGLEMVPGAAVLHPPAIRHVAARLVRARMAQASEPRRQRLIGVVRRRSSGRSEEH